MKQTDLHKNILHFLLFNFVWICLRMFYTETFAFRFLFWNLFLAAIPFVVSFSLFRYEVRSKIQFWFCLLLWLAFFPNAPYMITDLIHLGESHTVPKWFDVLILFSCALCGLVLGLISLQYMHQFLLRRWTQRTSAIFVIASLFLSGYGIYLGRYLRWNTWDLLINPHALIRESWFHLKLLPENPKVAVNILFFGLLQWILYRLFKRNSLGIDSKDA